jgi:hypothetical protein
MPASSFIQRTIDAWQTLIAEAPALVASSTVRRSADETKAVVEIETPRHTALIELWEQASCLDTTTLKNGEGKAAILAAGPCTSEGDAIARLVQLKRMLIEVE